MAMSELKQKLLQYELKQIGFPNAVYIPESDKIKIQSDNDRLPFINDVGDISYGTEHANFVRNTLRPIVDRVNETVSAWEKSQDMPFDDLKQFRVLAEYNNIMLAARDDTIYGRGLNFVTWQYNHEHTGLDHGHYTEDYIIAKEDFAERSGLIHAGKILTPEQANEIVTVIENLMENDYDLYLTSEKYDVLSKIIENLREAYPQKETVKPEKTVEKFVEEKVNTITKREMDEQEFKNNMSVLLPDADSEAVDNLIEYASELDFDGVVSKNEYLKNTFTEFVLVTKNYDKEVAVKLLEVCKIFALNAFEIRGVANHLKNNIEPKNIIDMVINGECERTTEEYRESQEALQAFENGTLDYHGKSDKQLEKTQKSAEKPKTLAEKMEAANEKVKAQDTKNNNKKSRKKEQGSDF